MLQHGRCAFRPNYLLSNSTIRRLTEDVVGGVLTPGEFLQSVSFELDAIHNQPYKILNEEDTDDEEIREVEKGWLPPESEENYCHQVQMYTLFQN